MASKVVMWNMSVCFFVGFLLSNVCVNGETFTTSNNYDPPSRDYSIEGLFCATYDANQTLEWRSQYLWAAYCDSAGPPMGASLCGTCIQVNSSESDTLKNFIAYMYL